jgi:hypothetical protein
MDKTSTDRVDVTMYAVFRNGVRVSESEYDSKLSAQVEYDYWKNLLARWPDGSKLDIRVINRYKR